MIAYCRHNKCEKGREGEREGGREGERERVSERKHILRCGA